MAAYTPCGLSFRALTILIEHIEHGGDYPIVHHQDATPNGGGTRTASTARLIERGLLRQKNSKFTTITRHGHMKFLEAAGAWADFLSRAELANLDGRKYTLREFHEQIGSTKTDRTESAAAALARRRRNSMAYWEGETLSPERADTL